MDFSQLKRSAPVIYKPQITSTNTILKDMVCSATAILPEGFAIVAQRQTAGRGRMGRSFESPPEGLYLSMVFYPKCPAEDIACITPCVAVAVCRAIEKACNVSPDIKWPNDLLIDGKKICGILTESSAVRGKTFVITGIGINVNTPVEAFSPQVAEIAGSIYTQSGQKADTECLARALIEELDSMYSLWTEDKKCCLAEYRSRCINTGKDAILLENGSSAPAKIIGIDDNYALIALSDGEERHINCGEVSLR